MMSLAQTVVPVPMPMPVDSCSNCPPPSDHELLVLALAVFFGGLALVGFGLLWERVASWLGRRSFDFEETLLGFIAVFMGACVSITVAVVAFLVGAYYVVEAVV